MTSVEFDYIEKTAVITTSEYEHLKIRGNMNHITFYLEMKCTILYSNGNFEKDKLIHFKYDTQLNQCSEFHDEDLMFYNCLNIYNQDRFQQYLKQMIDNYLKP